MRYTFGHTSTAAHRLQKIAEFFDPLSAGVIREKLNRTVNSAIDLGCGPGYTTSMLAKASGTKNVTGIDQSGFFIEQAKENFPELTFVQADVTKLSDQAKVDLIYCRFLLSHLNNLPDLINTWHSLLNPGGLLVLDELEDIFTDLPVFKNYLQISSALVNSQGAELYIGKKLDLYTKGMKHVMNRTDTLPVKNRIAAAWFYGNTIGPWKDNAFIKENIPEAKVKEISDELLAIHNREESVSNITWKMKRIILTN